MSPADWGTDLRDVPKSWKDFSMLQFRSIAPRVALLAFLAFASLPAGALTPRGWKWG
jgi:hypothetical protein